MLRKLASFINNRKKKSAMMSLSRRDTLLRQMDFIIDTLEHNKFDIVYMENLKNPLTPDEKVYFIQQVDRIESAKNVVLWMKENAKTNKTFWEKLLRW